MESIEARLRQRLIEVNLELYMLLEAENEVDSYVKKFINEEPFPLDQLTAANYPSKFSYLKDLLEREFQEVFLQFTITGILNYELLNICDACGEIFELFAFPEDEDSRWLRFTLIGSVSEYLEEGSSHGI
jgi:hypothetical protein